MRKDSYDNSDRGKVTRHLARLTIGGEFKKAERISRDYKTNPRDTVRSLYEQGILRRRPNKQT